MKVDRELIFKLILESMADEDLEDEFSDLEVLMTQAGKIGRQDIVDGMNELYDTLMDNPESITQEELDGFIEATKEALSQETAQGECLSAKEQWATILADEKGEINRNWLARVGKTTGDEVALFGWGVILKVLTKFLGGSLGMMTGNPMAAFLTQEAIDFAWNAAPRIIEDMAFRPEQAWGKENVIEMFPILDKFNVSKEIYNMISPEAIGEISKAYADEIDAIVSQNPDACVDEIPDINDYFADWLGENPEMKKIMQRKTKPRKYLKSFRLNRESLFDSINEVLQEDEDEEGKDQSTFQLMSSKLGAFISSPDIENFRSGWNLIEAIEGLISDEESTYLKDKLFVALSMQDLIEGNEEFAIEIVDSVSPKEERMEFEHLLFRDLRAIGQYELAVSNALKDLNIDVEAMGEQLMLMTGGDQEKLEKAKARLLKYGEIEEHFEVDTETGGLLVGPLAKKFVNFAKNMEEIFGVAPRGDVDVEYGALAGLFTVMRYPKNFNAPIAQDHEVSAGIGLEWSPSLGYGLEITLYPTKLATLPSQILNDYYGIWVSQEDEGPNIGKLKIGLQSFEDDLEDNKLVQNDNGTYGFTKEEMKKKILELTGMDLDVLN